MSDDDNIRFVSSLDDAFALKRWLGERRSILGLDTETGGLSPYGCRLRLVQFGDPTGGWAVPAEDWKGLLRDLLRSYDGEVALHNARFDAHFLREHLDVELDWTKVHDTEVAAHCVYPPGRHGLKYLATQRIHPGAAGGQKALEEAFRKGHWNWETVPVDLPAYWAYGVMDTILTALLHENLQPEIDALGVREVYELERAVTAVIYKMERRGCSIDLDYCQQKYDALLGYCDEVRLWAKQTYGVTNVTANRQVAKALQDDGVALTVRTATGEWSMAEAVLASLDHPLAKAVLNIRSAGKTASSYFHNFLKQHDDGVLHPQIRQVAARTGRMSITNPAMQTLPKGPIVRDAFVARPGHRLVSVDYEQIELRIFASFAQELPLIEAINASDRGDGPDLHTWVAQTVYQDPALQKKDPRRNLAKNTQFCLVYGGGATKIAETAGVQVEEAESFLNEYLRLFPGVKRFQKHVESVVKQRLASEGTGYVRAPSGRFHPLMDEEGAYKCTNYLVQGSAADVLKQRMVHLDNSGFGDYMLLPVHDEVVFELPEDEAADAIPQITEAMQDLSSFAVPLRVDASKPELRWGACK